MDAYSRARTLIDQAHAADPARLPDGRAAEAAYADHMEAAVVTVVDEASPLLRLGARCQHLERWTLPRSSFPLDRVGYLTWRKTLYVRQATRAKELLLEAGVSPAEADEVFTWVSKTALKTNLGSQALEDAACLVFLEHEIGGFAATHAHYTEEKYLEILRKTWKKMSARAQQRALQLPLPSEIARLVQAALAKGD